MGKASFTLADLRNNVLVYPVTNPKTNYKQAMRFFNLQIIKKNSFLDYIMGGTEISLSIAVDFTLSNREPQDPRSLHYLDYNKNEYLHAIREVGEIL